MSNRLRYCWVAVAPYSYPESERGVMRMGNKCNVKETWNGQISWQQQMHKNLGMSILRTINNNKKLTWLCNWKFIIKSSILAQPTNVNVLFCFGCRFTHSIHIMLPPGQYTMPSPKWQWWNFKEYDWMDHMEPPIMITNKTARQNCVRIIRDELFLSYIRRHHLKECTFRSHPVIVQRMSTWMASPQAG